MEGSKISRFSLKDRLIEKEICAEFGEDSLQEVDEGFNERIKEALTNGLSKHSDEKLR